MNPVENGRFRAFTAGFSLAVILLLFVTTAFQANASVLPLRREFSEKFLSFGKDLDFNPEYLDPLQESYKLTFTNKEIDHELDLHYFGARYYHAQLPRFISPDPVSGNPANPISWNRYLYCHNDPVNKFDPDGRDLQFANGVSGDFKTKVTIAIDYLNEHGAAGIIAQLHSEDEIIYLDESASPRSAYSSNSSTIYWNPDNATLSENGETISPALSLVHESGHAVRDKTDPVGYENDVNHKYASKSKEGKWSNAEEKRNIQEIEWSAAEKLGEDKRTSHRGTKYKVLGPTTVKPMVEFQITVTANE
jgi:RHS repeat-associated protein